MRDFAPAPPFRIKGEVIAGVPPLAPLFYIKGVIITGGRSRTLVSYQRGDYCGASPLHPCFVSKGRLLWGFHPLYPLFYIKNLAPYSNPVRSRILFFLPVSVQCLPQFCEQLIVVMQLHPGKGEDDAPLLPVEMAEDLLPLHGEDLTQ